MTGRVSSIPENIRHHSAASQMPRTHPGRKHFWAVHAGIIGSPTTSSNPTTKLSIICCDAAKNLIDQPAAIKSIGMRPNGLHGVLIKAQVGYKEGSFVCLGSVQAGATEAYNHSSKL